MEENQGTNEEEQNVNTDDEEQDTGSENTLTLTQAELDARINAEYDRRTAKHKADFDKQLEKAKADGKSEGQRLAQMTAEEKAAQEQAEKEDALSKREEALNKRELNATVRDLLSDKNLPAEMTDDLTELGDADKIKSVIEKLAISSENKINEGIKAGLRTDAPDNGASTLEGSGDPFDTKLQKYK